MISVIIPLYNKKDSIERAIQTVLEQSFKNIELIIVDDGSTDESLSIVNEQYSDNEKVIIIQQNNGGPSTARNTGVRNAKGEWIVFLDADDELTEGALQMMMNEVMNYPDADIIDFNGYIRRETKISKRYHPLIGRVRNPLKAFFYRQISPGCGHSIFKASFVKKYPYDERLRRFEDCEILLRMLPDAKVYSSQHVTEIHDINYAEASNARKNIMEDFTGYLDMDKGGFWYRMNIFRIFVEEREHYPEDCRRLYKRWYRRYDMLLMMKIFDRLKCFWG